MRPKRSLNEARSLPTTRSKELGSDKKRAVANTVSAPTFFEDHLNYHYFGREDQQDEDENEDRRRGLFRNRLFSTWTGWSDQWTKNGIFSDNNNNNKLNCDTIDKWQDGRQTVRRKSTKEPDRGAREIDHDDDRDVDGGYAWIILIVMFVINGSTFGTARAYGLIFENSARRDDGQSRSDAALPFTVMGAVENMAGPLAGYLLARTGSWRALVLAGSCLITLSHLLAAYCDSQLGQLLTIGLMCGIGQSFISISSFQINNAYFVRYRSRAFGIGLTGAALGTFYISPLCQFVLDHYTRSLCYLMLGLILLPNVFLSLLLKPKKQTGGAHLSGAAAGVAPHPAEVGSTLSAVGGPTVGPAEQAAVKLAAKQQSQVVAVFAISAHLSKQTTSKEKGTEEDRQPKLFWCKVGRVLSTPVFHLIWPTQLLFCWLNFVFGMIITDLGKDRGLNETQNSHLIVIWASGQLFGRLCLGSLADLKILSYKSFTMICFASISLITFMLNNFDTTTGESSAGELASNMICLMVFVLSMFISTLYILFNGLIVNYMEKSLTALSIGISSFTGSFFLLPRASIIGHYRDTYGNYDAMLSMFTWVTMISALVWLIVPALCTYLRKRRSERATGISQVNELLSDCSIGSSSISIGPRK